MPPPMKSKSLLDYLSITRAVLFNQFLNAAEAGDRGGVANVAGRLLEALRELGRLSGELRQLSGLTINQNQINIIASPQFIALQEGLLKVARAHPEARGDIVLLLRSLDATPAPVALKPNGAAAPVMIEGAGSHVFLIRFRLRSIPATSPSCANSRKRCVTSLEHGSRHATASSTSSRTSWCACGLTARLMALATCSIGFLG